MILLCLDNPRRSQRDYAINYDHEYDMHKMKVVYNLMVSNWS